MRSVKFPAAVMWRCVFWHVYPCFGWIFCLHLQEIFCLSRSIFIPYAFIFLPIQSAFESGHLGPLCSYSISPDFPITSVDNSDSYYVAESPLREPLTFSRLSLFQCFSFRLPIQSLHLPISVLLFTCSIYSYSLNIVAPCSSETSVGINQITLVTSQKTIVFMKKNSNLKQ
jgi:hypothetical protein